MSLYPYLFRRVVFPSLDLLNGTSVGAKLALLEESQWLSLGRLRELQERKLDRILDWAGTASSFYLEHWKSAPDSTRAASEYPQLDGRPLITKQDLRKSLEAFPVPEYRGRVFEVKTSGSTGHPMTFFRSEEQESWFWALRVRMWQWGGYVLGEPYLTLNLNPRTAWKKRLQDVFFRCSYHGFNANSHDVDAVLEDLRRRRIRHLIGYASSLYLLSEALQQRGIENPGVSSILSTGDTLFPPYRRRIEETFGCGVVDYYGAGGEGLHLASQCERRRAYHLHIENTVVEILRDGEPVKPGETGEIVVTQLENRAMPLIRYATGDVATAHDGVGETCDCGRQLPLLRSVEGRVPDIVLAPDGTALVVHFFTILFEHLEGIAQFQIVQKKSEEITALIVAKPDYSKDFTEGKIRDAVSGASNGTLSVRFRYVSEIPPSDSGKYRLVISDLLSAPVATDGRFRGDVIRALSS